MFFKYSATIVFFHHFFPLMCYIMSTCERGEGGGGGGKEKGSHSQWRKKSFISTSTTTTSCVRGDVRYAAAAAAAEASESCAFAVHGFDSIRATRAGDWGPQSNTKFSSSFGCSSPRRRRPFDEKKQKLLSAIFLLVFA